MLRPLVVEVEGQAACLGLEGVQMPWGLVGIAVVPSRSRKILGLRRVGSEQLRDGIEGLNVRMRVGSVRI